MNNVEFNLQDHLRDMETRIVNKVHDVHETVRVQNTRIGKLEADAYKLKWIWRGVTGLFTLAWAWVATNILGG